MRMIDAILNAVLILAVTQLALGVILWLRVRKLYSYPGLLGFPVFGNLYYFYKTLFICSGDKLLEYFGQLAKQYGKNGICFHYGYGYHKVVIVTSPHVVKEIGFHPNLKDKPEYAFQAVRVYMDGPFTTPYTDHFWKIKRKEYDCLLRKSMIQNNFFDIFLKYGDRLVDLMLTSPSAFNIQDAVVGTVQSVTVETLMGVETSMASHPKVIHCMHKLGNIASLLVGNPLVGKIILKILKPIDRKIIPIIGAVRDVILEVISKKMNDNKQHLSSENTNSHRSLLTFLSSRIEKDKEFNQRVINELQELFISSTHTVATTLSSAITFLAVSPEIQEKAWQEQYEIFGDDTREPTVEEVEQMEYLERFIKETLRFCAPMFIGKQASGDIEVDGVIIPKGAIVVYLLDFMRKDPTYWKDPNVFEPDRFLEEDELLKYCFAPFGIGLRICPGTNFAMVQMKIALSKILRRTRISTVQKGLKFKDLEFQAQILIEVKTPPLIQIEERV